MSSSYYRSAEWRALRKAVLARDPVCATRGCGRPSSHVDHIVPRSRGGADSTGNCRGLCTSCHNRRSAGGRNGPLRAIGCDADGTPLDPNDPWHAWGRPLKQENLSASGPGDRGGVATQSKFPNGRRGKWD